MCSVTAPLILHRNAEDQTLLHRTVDQDSLPAGCLDVLDLLLKSIDKDDQDQQVCDVHTIPSSSWTIVPADMLGQ